MPGTGALRKRGQLDELPELVTFAGQLEESVLATLEDGVMTGDLLAVSDLPNKQKVNSEEFLLAIQQRLNARRS